MRQFLLAKTHNSMAVMMVLIVTIILGGLYATGTWYAALICAALGALLFFLLVRRFYNYFVALNIVLLSTVVIEPSPSDILFCGLLIAGIMAGLLSAESIKKALMVILLFLAYFIYSIVCIIVAQDVLGAIRFYLISLYLFLFSLFICVYARESNIIALQRAYVVSACLAAVAGLLGYVGIFSKMFMADAFRVRGLFKDPNVFGPFFVPAILMLLNDMKSKRIVKGKGFIHILLIAVFSFSVFLSFSRAAWINLIFSVVVYIVLNIRVIAKTKTFRLLILGNIILIGIVAVLWSGYIAKSPIGRFVISRAKIKSYDSERFAAQKSGLILLQRYPWGYGSGQYENEAQRVMKRRLSAHNLYLRIAVENGIVGFFLFFLPVGLLLIQLYINHRMTIRGWGANGSGISSSVLLSTLLGFLVVSLVVDTLHWRHFWLLIGLSMYSISGKKGKTI